MVVLVPQGIPGALFRRPVSGPGQTSGPKTSVATVGIRVVSVSEVIRWVAPAAGGRQATARARSTRSLANCRTRSGADRAAFGG